MLLLVTSIIPSEAFIIAGNFNIHAGQHSQGFSLDQVGSGYGNAIKKEQGY